MQSVSEGFVSIDTDFHGIAELVTGFIQEPDMVLTVVGTDLRHLVETMRLARANAEIDRRTE